MMMRTTASFLVLGLLICTLSGVASAQSGPCVLPRSIWSWENPDLYFGVYDCTPNGIEGSVPCKIQTSFCPPVAGPPENPICCGSAGHPISLASGDTYIIETDVRLSGLGGGLTLVRTWNSLWPPTQSAFQTGLFGPNWRSNFEERVFLGSDHYLKYARGDGSFWSFGVGCGGWSVAAPANASATLVQGTSYWTLTLKSGEQKLFDNNSGKLTAIVDRNGNTTQLTYDSLGRLVTVTDPASRHLYFGYGSGTYLVATATSDFGVSVSYSYDSQGRLSQVTEPDGSTLSFQYDSNSFISAVLDSNGKILESHTYDSSGRGLTSSRANGVDAVTISYQ